MGFMTYEEIGNEIGITKQAVSQNIKKAVNKTYNFIFKNIADDAFDALVILIKFLNINNHDDFKQMYKLINKKYKNKIEVCKEWER